jgi:hypothetical protein
MMCALEARPGDGQDNGGIMDTIIVRYLAEHNPGGAWFPGVPLRDLTQEEWANVPGWLKASCIASGMYELLGVPQVETAVDKSHRRSERRSSGN